MALWIGVAARWIRAVRATLVVVGPVVVVGSIVVVGPIAVVGWRGSEMKDIS